MQNGNSVDSICIICGKATENSSENLYDIAESMNLQVASMAQICTVTGDDVDNDSDLIEYIKKIEKMICL